MNHITVQELKAKIDAGEDVKIIDVREMNEIEEYNIGAVPLPLSRLSQMDAEPIEDWTEEEVFIHCRSGVRSLQACQILETMGFRKTVNVTGGILAWKEAYGDTQLK